MDTTLPGLATLFQTAPWLILLWLVPMGAAMGSFINCMADRIPRGVSLRKPPSYCDSCHTTLTPPELVPLASWLIQRGRCKHCGAGIPARNFWLEVFTTLTPVALFLLLGAALPVLLATLAVWLVTGVVVVKTQRVT